MSNIRSYSLPIDLLDAFDLVSHGNRSATLRKVIGNATDNDILTALVFRLQRPTASGRPVRVTLATSEDAVSKLKDMSDRSGLPMEHVLRLLIEGYIRKVSSHKESHGSASSLEPAASG